MPFKKIIYILCALTALTVLSLAVFANGMTKQLGRDENMYCTGGILLANGSMPYRDFSYVSQLPFHPLLYAAVFRIFRTSYYLLTARLLSCLCDILTAICIVHIYRRLLGPYNLAGLLLGLAGATLYVFNPAVDYANGFAWNNDIVVAMVMFCFCLSEGVDFRRPSGYWRTAAVAALLTAAAFMRITIALVELLFFVFLVFYRADSASRRLKTAVVFLSTALLMSLWPLYAIALALVHFSWTFL